MINAIFFDIEVFVNMFYIHFKVNDKDYGFEISFRKDDREELKVFLREYKDWYFVGFNVLRYDGKILTFLIQNLKLDKEELLPLLKRVSDQIINEDERYYESKYFQYLDLAEIGGYNTRARHASLKQIEFNMRLPNIELTPVDFNAPVKNDKEADEVIKYCKYDVFATAKLYEEMTDVIRIRLDDTYPGILNLPDTKLGETIMQYELGLSSLYVDRNEFDWVEIKDIIYPYIKFDIPAFNELKRYLSSKKIKTPKGFFSLIPKHELGDLIYYMDTTMKKGSIKKLNVIFNGLTYYIGAGGIHASRKGIFIANKKRKIVDIDVSSYYPFNIINNHLIPKLVGEELTKQGKEPEYFLEKYVSFYKRRKLYKKPHPLNTLFKLALNIIFGKSLQPVSIFGDLELGMSVTINGQLLLLMLIEWLHENVPDLTIIQANTDGITLETDVDYEEKIKDIVKEWENITGFNMEFAYYEKMVIANVNNYIALYTDGKIKSKGSMFAYKDLEHYKDHSELIIPKALEAYFVKGLDYRSFIREHDDLYDFFKKVRTNKGSRLVYRTENLINFEQELPPLVRYLVTKKGGKLVKILPPLEGKTEEREEEVEAGKKVTLFNIVPDNPTKYLKYIDYKYYIDKCSKIIAELEQ